MRLRIEGRGWFVAILLMITIMSVRCIYPVLKQFAPRHAHAHMAETSYHLSNLHPQGNECEISFEDENGVHTHVFQKEDIRDANGGRMQLVQIQKSSL